MTFLQGRGETGPPHWPARPVRPPPCAPATPASPSVGARVPEASPELEAQAGGIGRRVAVVEAQGSLEGQQGAVVLRAPEDWALGWLSPRPQALSSHPDPSTRCSLGRLAAQHCPRTRELGNTALAPSPLSPL